jgi:transcriptional regulator with XRE-family HTH domain
MTSEWLLSKTRWPREWTRVASEVSSPSDTATDEQAEHAEDSKLGLRLRELRKQKGLSLRVVAADAQLSESFLSQVELARASPSVASLRRICQALGESMGSLFMDAEESTLDDDLVRVRDRRRIVRPDGSVDYLLTPKKSDKLQVHQTLVRAGRTSGPELYVHDGDEECVIVLEGSLTLRVADRTYVLETGDSLLLDPKTGHGFSNPTDHDATVLWIITPANGDM